MYIEGEKSIQSVQLLRKRGGFIRLDQIPFFIAYAFTIGPFVSSIDWASYFADTEIPLEDGWTEPSENHTTPLNLNSTHIEDLDLFEAIQNEILPVIAFPFFVIVHMLAILATKWSIHYEALVKYVKVIYYTWQTIIIKHNKSLEKERDDKNEK